MLFVLKSSNAAADPFYGPALPGPGGPAGPNAPSGNQGSPYPGQGTPPPGQNTPGPYNPLQNNQQNSGNNPDATGSPGGNGPNGTPENPAPTFMNGTPPNTQGPFAPAGVSPGTLTAPITSLYQLQGVPSLAAPLMGQVYRPFGLTLFQPNVFQVVPQGVASLTGTFETDTNIDYSPTNPQVGALYTITPAVAYSTFDDYGYLSVLASATYNQYISGQIPPYLDEVGGLEAGSYFGDRIFAGVMDFVTRGNSPNLSGSPMQFLNGVDPIFTNTMGAEIGFALTPKITFVQTALDYYFDGTAFGAGISNIQSLGETLEYIDKTTMLLANYTYSQGLFSIYPDFISNGVSGTAMHSTTRTTAVGVSGGYTDYTFAGDPLLDFTMIEGTGNIYHAFNRNVTGEIVGGYNVITFASGQSFPGPLVDGTITYASKPLTATLNAGWFEENQMTYGIEIGPVDVKQILATLQYIISPKTFLIASGGYADYTFFQAPAFSNSFFKTLRPGTSYGSTAETETDGIFWMPAKWILLGLEYNFIDFSSNIPGESVIDNQFIALISLYFRF